MLLPEPQIVHTLGAAEGPGCGEHAVTVRRIMSSEMSGGAVAAVDAPDRLAAASRWMPVRRWKQDARYAGMSSDVRRCVGCLGAPDCWQPQRESPKAQGSPHGTQGMSSDAGGVFVPAPRLPGQEPLKTQAVLT
jgi:hypothetical protein